MVIGPNSSASTPIGVCMESTPGSSTECVVKFAVNSGPEILQPALLLVGHESPDHALTAVPTHQPNLIVHAVTESEAPKGVLRLNFCSESCFGSGDRARFTENTTPCQAGFRC